jgi:hypothetical protein
MSTTREENRNFLRVDLEAWCRRGARCEGLGCVKTWVPTLLRGCVYDADPRFLRDSWIWLDVKRVGKTKHASSHPNPPPASHLFSPSLAHLGAVHADPRQSRDVELSLVWEGLKFDTTYID